MAFLSKDDSESKLVTPKYNNWPITDDLKNIYFKRSITKFNSDQYDMQTKMALRTQSFPMSYKHEKAFKKKYSSLEKLRKKSMTKKYMEPSYEPTVPKKRTKKRNANAVTIDDNQVVHLKPINGLVESMDIIGGQKNHASNETGTIEYSNSFSIPQMAEEELMRYSLEQKVILKQFRDNDMLSNTIGRARAPKGPEFEDVIKIKRNLFGNNSDSPVNSQDSIKTPTSVEYCLNQDADKFDLRKTLDKFLSDILLFKQEKKKLIKENETLKSENEKVVQSLKTTLNSALIQIDIKKKASEEENKKFLDIEAEYKKISDLYESLQRDCKHNEYEYKTTKSNLCDLKLNHDNLKSVHEDIKMRYESLQTENIELQKKYDGLYIDYEKKTSAFEELKSVHSSVLDSLVGTQETLDLKSEWLQEVEDKYKKTDTNWKNCLQRINILKSHLVIIENNCNYISKGKAAEMESLGYIDQINSEQKFETKDECDNMISKIMLCLNEIHYNNRACKELPEPNLPEINAQKILSQSKHIDELNTKIYSVVKDKEKCSTDNKMLIALVNKLEAKIDSHSKRMTDFENSHLKCLSTQVTDRAMNNSNKTGNEEIGMQGDNIEFIARKDATQKSLTKEPFENIAYTQ